MVECEVDESTGTPSALTGEVSSAGESCVQNAHGFWISIYFSFFEYWQGPV